MAKRRRFQGSLEAVTESKAEAVKETLESLDENRASPEQSPITETGDDERRTSPTTDDGPKASPDEQQLPVQPDGGLGEPASNTFDAAPSKEAPKEPAVAEAKDGSPEQRGLVPVSISKERLRHLEERFRRNRDASMSKAAEAIEDILTIRDERQYEADGYATFQDYLDDRWHYSRAWVEQMELRLHFFRLMEAKLGVSPDEAKSKLGLFDTNILRPLQDDPDVLVAAVQEANERYAVAGKKSPKILREVVAKWQDYKAQQARLEAASPKEQTSAEENAQPLTPEEFKELAQLRRNKSNPRRLGLVGQAKEKAQAENIPLMRALDRVCEEAGHVPPDEELLKEARGEALKELVAPLAARVRVWRAEDKRKESEAYKEVEKATVELERLQHEMAKTPEQKEQERRQQEEERRRQEELAAEREKERQEAQERFNREQEMWAWEQDDLSLPAEADPRKWSEAENHEWISSDVLVRIAADCLADAVKRLSEMDEAERSTTIRAADKALKLAKELSAKLAPPVRKPASKHDKYFPDEPEEK